MLKKSAIRLGILIAFLFLNTSLFAGDGSGKVIHLMVHAGDIVIFSIGSHNNKPACSTIGDHWALSLKTNTGRAMYSLLLSSAAQGKVVIIAGTGACGAWSDREEPRYIYSNN